ncbi:unnamed protein product [Owenia fusiformis]|uniref:Centrosomal protein kizuna n=1 Tax=Owenia fusiformis TaxID=6347 RepID=A0A8S4PD46_OWEFU|nr:unnamed protein product [Owenia fusiformis]
MVGSLLDPIRSAFSVDIWFSSVPTRRETGRLELEQELNTYSKSDSRLANLRAQRLQTHWKKICEEEKRRRKRNEQLIRDFERVENHMKALNARSQNLQVMKNQYEEYIDRMYPRWKEQVKLWKYQKETQKQVQPQPVVQNLFTEMSLGPLSIPLNQTGQYDKSLNTVLQQNDPSMNAHLQQNDSSLDPQLQQSDSSMNPSHLEEASQEQLLKEQLKLKELKIQQLLQQKNAEVQLIQQLQQQKLQQGLADSRISSSMNSQNTNAQNLTRGDPYQNSHLASMSNTNQSAQFSTQYQMGSSGLQTLTDITQGSTGMNFNVSGKQGGMIDTLGATMQSQFSTMPQGAYTITTEPPTPLTNPHNKTADSSDESLGVSSIEDKEQEAFIASLKLPSKESSPRKMNSAHSDDRVDHIPPKGPAKQASQSSIASGPTHFEVSEKVGSTPSPGAAAYRDDQEVDQFDDDLSLPLSPDDHPTSKSLPKKSVTPRGMQHPPRATTPESLRGKQTTPRGSKSSITSPRSEVAVTSSSPGPVLSYEGLYCVFEKLRDDFGVTFNEASYFRSPPLPADRVNEIVDVVNASGSKGLEDLDCIDFGVDLSMLVLQQLPLIIQTLQGGCILSDKAVNPPIPATSEANIRGYIYSSDLDLWDHVFGHMTSIVKCNIMNSDETASIFAPLLISKKSKLETKASNTLAVLLKNAYMDDSDVTDTSSVSLPTMPATVKNSTLSGTIEAIGDDTLGKSNNKPKVPPLNLGSPPVEDEDESSEDDSYNQTVPQQSKVPLTETAAYRSMLAGTMTSTTRQESDVDSDSSDDIEAQLGSQSHKSSNQKNNADRSLGGTGSLGLSYGSNTIDVSPTPSVETRRSSVKTDALSPNQSPLPSPMEPYVPTAMEKSGKSTMSSFSGLGSTGGKKKPAYMMGADSDLDSDYDIDIPMGNTGLAKVTSKPNKKEDNDEEDDFDFYG